MHVDPVFRVRPPHRLVHPLDKVSERGTQAFRVSEALHEAGPAEIR